MGALAWRWGLFLLAIILIQHAFFSVLFPKSVVPFVVFSAVAALVLVQGFREGLARWLLLILAYDLLRSGMVTPVVPVGILLAYGMSFLSRRFVLEQRGVGVWIAALVLAGFSLTVHLLWWLVSGQAPPFILIVGDTGGALFGFLLLFPIVRRLNERWNALVAQEFRGLRQRPV